MPEILAVGQSAIFRSPYDQYRERNGQTCQIVTVIDQPDADHDAESLPMYWITFEDGAKIEAWPEELEACK